MSPNSSISLSLIIPVFNEAGRLPATFVELKKFLIAPPCAILEVIFVNDGSTDDTRATIEKEISKHSNTASYRLINFSKNLGKGAAVKAGMLEAKGDYCLMLDADLSTPLAETIKFLPHMKSELPVIIGTRKGVDAIIKVHQPWHRQKMGELYALLARRVTGLPLRDFGCGFKMFSQGAAKAIFPRLKTNGWIFDTEALYLAKLLHLPIKEVGVVWTDDPDTRVRLWQGTVGALADLFTIRLKSKI